MSQLETAQPSCDVGLVGLAVMGQNLALNIADHGFQISVYNGLANLGNANSLLWTPEDGFTFFDIGAGGGWFDDEPQATTYNRNCGVPDKTINDDLGFRCARSK